VDVFITIGMRKPHSHHDRKKATAPCRHYFIRQRGLW
jgi:hypothetical protein